MRTFNLEAIKCGIIDYLVLLKDISYSVISNPSQNIFVP